MIFVVIIMLKPDIKLDRITEITPDMLRKRGIEALLLDVDNTMSTHHGQVLTDGLTEWISLMLHEKIKLIVVSNSKRARVEPFAEKIGLDFISLACKPLPFGYLHAVGRLGVKRKAAAIVGDQIFTDIIGGNCVGVNTVLLTPIKPEDGLSFKIRRRLERVVFRVCKIVKTEE